MDNQIFQCLSKYSSSEKMSPKENFLTELFAWMLRNIKDLRSNYVAFLNDRLDASKRLLRIPEEESIAIETQYSRKHNSNTIFIDLVIKTGSNVLFACEHKIDSFLSEGQVEKYKVASGATYTVLLTRRHSQHTQEADVKIIWDDIKGWTKSFIENNGALSEVSRFLLDGFISFLDFDSPSLITKDQIVDDDGKAVCEIGSALMDTITTFLIHMIEDESTNKAIKEHCDTLINVLPHLQLEYAPQKSRMAWGRKGIDLLGRDWDSQHNGDKLGLFVGLLSDEERKDHYWKVDGKLDTSKGVDLVVIMDVTNQIKDQIAGSVPYHRIEQYLSPETCSGWDFLPSSRLGNRWRLAILRKPLLDILFPNGVATQDIEKQKSLFQEEVMSGVELMVKGLSSECKK